MFDGWAIEATELWLGSFGGFEALRSRAYLATPTEDDFPIDPDLDDAAIASDCLAFAQVHARLEEWKFEMVPVPSFDAIRAIHERPHHGTAKPVPTGGHEPTAEGEGLPIAYDPSDVHDRASIVATIARGMSHYLIQHALIDAPAQADEHEYLVDHGAVFLGFGIFLANAALHVYGGAPGTRAYRRRGALTEYDVSTVLALFGLLLDIPERDVDGHLDANPKEYFRVARTRLQQARSSALDELREVKARSRGPFR